MRITQIDIFNQPLAVANGAYVMSSGVVTELESLIVKITTDTGIIGWGECCPLGNNYDPSHPQGVYAALALLTPSLIGQPVDPKANFENMQLHLKGNLSAKAAFDIALHDIIGKTQDRPCVDLFGGAANKNLPSYYAISVNSPENTSEIAKEKVEQGYQRLQIKIGGRAIEDDIQTARLCCDAVGSKAEIVLDANRGLSADETILISRSLSDCELVIEQPCDSLSENRRIKPLLHHPLYLDESAADMATCRELIEARDCDGFGMKLTRIGGMLKMKQFSDLCCDAKLPHTCDDSWGGDIIAAACTHVAASIDPNYLKGVWIASPYIKEHYDLGGGIEIHNGSIDLPIGPGLGIQPKEANFGAPILSQN